MTFRALRKLGYTIALGLLAWGVWWWARLPYRHFPLVRAQMVTDSLGRRVLQPTVSDLPYANRSDYEKLDLFLPGKSNRDRIPVIIWIHGGGFTTGDKTLLPRRDFAAFSPGVKGRYQVQVPDLGALLERGYAVVSLNYHLGLSPVTASRSGLRDGKAAIRFLHENAKKYGLDEDRFVVWGNSVGGYMAAMIGVTADQTSALDDFDLCKSGRSDVRAVIVWFGAEDRMPSRSLRITTYIPSAKILPEFLIANGDRDDVISVAQATRLYDALSAAGAKVTLKIVPGAGHEDPLFTETQMLPALAFIANILHQ